MLDSDQNMGMATDAPPSASDSLKIFGRYHPYSWLGQCQSKIDYFARPSESYYATVDFA